MLDVVHCVKESLAQPFILATIIIFFQLEQLAAPQGFMDLLWLIEHFQLILMSTLSEKSVQCYSYSPQAKKIFFQSLKII